MKMIYLRDNAASIPLGMPAVVVARSVSLTFVEVMVSGDAYESGAA